MNSKFIECKALISQATETIKALQLMVESICSEPQKKHFAFMNAVNAYNNELDSRKSAISDGIAEYDAKLMEIENEINALQPKLVMATAMKNAVKVNAIQEEISSLETSRTAYERGKALLASAELTGPARAYADVETAFAEEMEYARILKECQWTFANELENQAHILQSLISILKNTEGWEKHDGRILNQLPSAED